MSLEITYTLQKRGAQDCDLSAWSTIDQTLFHPQKAWFQSYNSPRDGAKESSQPASSKEVPRLSGSTKPPWSVSFRKPPKPVGYGEPPKLAVQPSGSSELKGLSETTQTCWLRKATQIWQLPQRPNWLSLENQPDSWAQESRPRFLALRTSNCWL